MNDIDPKDNEIEKQFQEIYETAMSAYEALFQEVDLVEGKYKARTGEVAVQFLNTALNAAGNKMKLKQGKDKNTPPQLSNDGPTLLTKEQLTARLEMLLDTIKQRTVIEHDRPE
jgi:hypothetical protein